MIFTGIDKVMIDAFKASMMTKFDMRNLGLINYFLGLEVVQSIARIFMSQKKSVLEILSRFQMEILCVYIFAIILCEINTIFFHLIHNALKEKHKLDCAWI